MKKNLSKSPIALLSTSLLLLSTFGCGSSTNTTETSSQVPVAVAAKAAVAAAPDSKFVPDELLVQFAAGVSQGQVDDTFRSHAAQEVEENKAIHVKRIKVPAQALQQVKQALAKNPRVKFVEENFLAKSGGIPNDASYPSQWHLPKISAPQGWDTSIGSVSVPIAVVDSGVDPTHPDLAGKLLPGYNFLNGSTDTHDVLGHGTAVAGTAAANSNNGIGVAGVGWQNPVMPLVVLDSTDYASYSNIARAITYAADQGVRIINVSIGGSSASSTLQNAVTYAWNKGALVFVSAMNNGTSTPYYPAACTNAIAVASTDSADNRSSFSNYGAWITISAPGSYIYTTNNGGGYGAWNGTSFSSPIAAGLGALILSVNPSLTNQQVRDIMIQNSDDLGSAGFDQYFGYGRVNVAKSLLAAKSFVPAADTAAPVVSFNSPASGTIVSGQATVSVGATDNAGVTKVELYLNGALLATDVIGPYTFLVDTTRYPNGGYTFEARGYDAAGNTGRASSSIVISNSKDITAPIVSFLSPTSGTSLVGVKSTTIAASAADNVAVTRMELYVDTVLKASSTSANLSWNWNLQKVASGQHTLVVKAFDAGGNAGSTAVTVSR